MPRTPCSESLSERLTSLKLARREDLECLLLALCAYGKPVLHRVDNGWYCKVSMHVAAKGTSFDVASDFSCASPIVAARECTDRIVATLEAMDSGLPNA